MPECRNYLTGLLIIQQPAKALLFPELNTCFQIKSSNLGRDIICLFLAISSVYGGEEDLSSPPVVTAKSWVVMNTFTGDILRGEAIDEPRKSASITKAMCAYTILQLATENPGVLNENVTFSELADKTAGSTADVNAGESVKLGDLLYALLLPSGNDAGNAIAEHLNARLDPPDDIMLEKGLSNPRLVTRVNFIAEMNRNARKLKMKDTFYRSSFGDGGTREQMTTTVRDLCTFTFHAMKDPEFRKIVGTRKYEAAISQVNGEKRIAVWESSNSLLELDLGYNGIKTGTTRSAGYCLLANGKRGAKELTVVVLDSDSLAARYAEARNLFRWGWTYLQNTSQ